MDFDGRPIEYPASDGEPMSETPIHWQATVDAAAALKRRYRGRDDVFVGSDQLLYYEEGNVQARFAPDVFVIFDVSPEYRRVWKLWEEADHAPRFVLEITSKSTRLDDQGNKKALCLRLGVDEYVLFDPEGDYLDTRLKGYRREGDEYLPMRAGPGGVIASEVLGVNLFVEHERLRMVDATTGEKLPWVEEMERAHDEAERARAEAERSRAEAARLAARLRELGVEDP